MVADRSGLCLYLPLGGIEQNLAMQDQLMALRASTASAYATAQHLQDRWKEVEQKQAGLYSVSRRPPRGRFAPVSLHYQE